MKKVKALTGYFPAFPAKHLSEEQFRAYGDQLKEALDDQLVVFGDGYTIKDCWAHNLLVNTPGLMPSDRNPAPDRFEAPIHMVYSNIAILQRFRWLLEAMVRDPSVDQWVWLEYTIFKQPGVTATVIKQFMQDVADYPKDAVSLAGCWPMNPIDDGAICWRFVGSSWVCPRELVQAFGGSAITIAALRTATTKKISWDVNTLAYLELLNMLPMRWYPGNHDATQLTNYKGTDNA